MAALVCDLCGGKLVMGAGGIAVCDSCGMEYSTERMREKVQMIKGSVQIDNSNMVDTWMRLAMSAAQAGNQKEAYDYYAKVIEVEPQNWRAIFGKGKAAAWQSTLANSRTSELYQAVKKAIEIIDNSGMSEEEVILRKNEFAVAIYNVNTAFLDLRQSNFDKHEERYYDLHWDEWWESHYVQGTENIEQTEDVMTLIKDFSDDTSKRNVLEMKKHICEVLCYICSCSSTCWDSYDKEYLKCYGLTESSKEPFIKKYIGLVEEIQEAEPDFQISNFCLLDPWSPPNEWSSGRYDEVVEYWQKREDELRLAREKRQAQKRTEKYWQEHAEEKKQYDARTVAINAEITDLKGKIDQYDSKISEIRKDFPEQLPDERKLIELKQNLSELTNQKTKLGIFAGKQKKQLQEQIDSLQRQIPEMEKSIMHQKETIQNDVFARIDAVENERRPYCERLSELENERESIIEELTKDR